MSSKIFERQIQLIGQEKHHLLTQTRVLIVGVGGLGCPALLHLASCGVEHIGIVDGDLVQENNLHRQNLFTPAQIGKLKVEAAKEFIEMHFVDCEIEIFRGFINSENLNQIAKTYDYILDGTDVIETRYLLDDYCAHQNKKYVYGSVYKHQGQWALINTSAGTRSYENIFDNKNATPLTCNNTGIVATTPAYIGLMQAMEIIKHILDHENYGYYLQHINLLTMETYKIELR